MYIAELMISRRLPCSATINPLNSMFIGLAATPSFLLNSPIMSMSKPASFPSLVNSNGEKVAGNAVSQQPFLDQADILRDPPQAPGQPEKTTPFRRKGADVAWISSSVRLFYCLLMCQLQSDLVKPYYTQQPAKA